jgi:hypothetical protein
MAVARVDVPISFEDGLDRLDPVFAYRLGRLMQDLWLHRFDAMVFEGFRSRVRQRYLFSIGRTREKGRAVVTDRLDSEHCRGRAADVVSADRLWDCPGLFDYLDAHIGEFGLERIQGDRAHVQMGG